MEDFCEICHWGAGRLRDGTAFYRSLWNEDVACAWFEMSCAPFNKHKETIAR
jgi:hypothetical protein